ncbi:MAG: hypothetical protein HRU18_03630 [Pseudoalteromonas sp.]|uniref:hypothetical protein n=1 Tax=Pseudoalteromonas sp. TaxID=53249 RepID=UPI001D58BF2B|nr:hypothetical protein [Pseudoalteromonas sp.]NRA77277.1 hypothetical protein [Pseudoalteromonas sp.]
MLGLAIAGGLQGAMGLAGGISKFFEGRDMQKRAQEYIDKFEWEDLKNVFRGNQVSTLGSDLRAREAARDFSTTMDNIRGAGARGIVGSVGQLNQQRNLMNQQIGADLDQQQKAIDMAASQDDARIRAMKEQRQAQELAGYGQMLNTGMGMKYSGISDGINAIGAGAQAAALGGSPTPSLGGGASIPRQTTQPITNLLSQGIMQNPSTQNMNNQQYLDLMSNLANLGLQSRVTN